MVVYKEFTFQAAHVLPLAGGGHKCAKLHGHTYQVRISVEGPISSEKGWVLDFAEIQEHFAPILNQLDHTYLNDVAGLDNPTVEHLAIWIWDRLSPQLRGLKEITIRETPTAGCSYSGPA
jgi:6-pyruvoyltetrahydropterin/6-carboxytetrahydropterin synthase